MHNDDSADEGPSLVSNRVVEIITALLFLLGSGIVIFDSVRLGYGWIEGQGPAPGYFPFYIALAMGVASLVTLAQAVRGKTAGAAESFVSVVGFGRVLAVLVPSILYVMLIGGLNIGPVAIPGLGLYVASAIFITLFMIVFGKDNPLKAIAVGVFVPVVLFLMFETWFKVPLPKGPLEAMLGY
jgi:uncharacterized membrane protein